jgi:hypothetical protein
MSESQNQGEGKRPPWRPSDYDPSFCERVVELGKLGKSRAWIAAELGVVRSTLKNWEAAHPDFLVAMERAQVESQRWWEDEGQYSLSKMGYQSSMWSRSMAARFPDDWRETTRHENTGANGNPMEVKHSGVDEVISRIARLAARSRESGDPEQSR